jgi:serine/tyrosine/threonine adenylyltransferase
MPALETLNFDNHFARLGPQFSSPLPPAPLPDPYLVSANPDVAALIDLDPEQLLMPEFVRFVSGSWLPPGSEPIAMLYAGHQFGQYVPQLGDGRAILTGQVRNARDETWDLQLKGAGETPYSRMADGRAVLRSTIREYLGSEAMHHLGIPTSRAMGIVGSDFPVLRETVETAAVLLRVSPSHVRFGSFEVFFYRNQHQHIRTLADYVIRQHFPEISEAPGTTASYFAFLREVVVRTARMIAHWQTVGFAHGVMNTDNMSILGLTFDYGPYGFMEAFDPDFICNHSDESGRYAFSNQPTIAFWNLCCLAQALTPLLPVEQCREALSGFEPVYRDTYARLFRAKLGLKSAREEDAVLTAGLLQILQGNAVDYPKFFRALSSFASESGAPHAEASQLFRYPEAFEYWSADYRTRLAHEGAGEAERQAGMRAANPRYVLRNWLAQRAIDRAQQKDFSEVDGLLNLLRRPFDDQPGFEEYAGPAPADFIVPGVSCSS